eukprot:7564168-Karenia_brevis.AAC.1
MPQYADMIGGWSAGNLPEQVELQTLLHAISSECFAQSKKNKEERVRAWRQRLASSLRDGTKHAYAWCKGEMPSPLAVVERAD